MPQLTLFSDPTFKSLGLSREKPRVSPSSSGSRGSKTSRIAAFTKLEDEPNLWEMHHHQENMATSSKDRHTDGDRAKGQPGKRERSRSPEGGGVAGRDAKKHKNAYEIRGRVAAAEVAAKVDKDPPLDQLLLLLKHDKKAVKNGESVVYWMRMEDMRVEDNTALAHASEKAKELEVPLIVLFVISPGDYKMHDRSPRRIDFMLRNLRHLKARQPSSMIYMTVVEDGTVQLTRLQQKFDRLNIPLHIVLCAKRLLIPKILIGEIFPHLRTNHVFANIEYEVDELRRDIATVKIGRESGIDVVCVHDRLIVPPGRITSQAGKPMSVFSPWQRAWAKLLEKEPHLLELSDPPHGNDVGIRQHEHFGKLFDATSIPDQVEGFECEDREEMAEVWPEGTEVAKELLDRFLHTKPRKSQLQLVSPLTPGAEQDDKNSRIQQYQTGRNLVNGDNSSKLSPYLASGVISGRMVLAEARKLGKLGKLESGRDTGVGMWVQEVSWRDFYNHIMSTWPRISMGRPFLEKFADVQWEVNEDHLQAWKDGKTGFPIVDAAMRACKHRGWMENRVRMVAASFLVKGLMLDWRLGERHFMESFIDGDLAANNGGWQWTASTGTDPQPYFRIFNTLTQSEKCDPNGDYIRYWVPELKNLNGKAVHDPFHQLPSGEFRKLGYPPPIIDHKQSRERALFRYKNVGEKEG